MRDEARKATIMAFRHRCTEHVALKGQERIFGKPKIRYAGDFDYQAVADSVDLPKDGDLNRHKVAWNFLYREFDKAWQEHNNRTPAEVF
jgi:hypothetical protein|tara:strand:- start:267 stop:533 length:267 start_codon:yes stop_codon:yes gene_type:complete